MTDIITDWYVGFVAKRLQCIIDEDAKAYDNYGISIMPDWVNEQGKELYKQFLAINSPIEIDVELL